jgi:hypothetical protein
LVGTMTWWPDFRRRATKRALALSSPSERFLSGSIRPPGRRAIGGGRTPESPHELPGKVSHDSCCLRSQTGIAFEEPD